MENRTTVLYVDDNPKSSRLLTSVLEECRFRCDSARNDPQEALALCQRTYFDLALLDYEMPMMSGSKLAHGIKFLRAGCVPIVLISVQTLFRLRTGVCGRFISGLERRSTICCGRCGSWVRQRCL